MFFLAALLVMKIALTAMLCVLVVSGGIVIALYPLPQGDGLARLWLSGLVCAVAVPVAWALIFAVAGLVSADALAWSGGLGEGLAALVKPFVAVACLYLAYRRGARRAAGASTDRLPRLAACSARRLALTRQLTWRSASARRAARCGACALTSPIRSRCGRRSWKRQPSGPRTNLSTYRPAMIGFPS